MIYRAEIILYIEADSNTDAARRAIAEALRPVMQKYASGSPILDWEYRQDWKYPYTTAAVYAPRPISNEELFAARQSPDWPEGVG